MPEATIRSFTSMNQFLRPNFPEGSYSLGSDEQKVPGEKHDKEYILNVAGKLFQENSAIYSMPPIDYPPAIRRIQFYDANHKYGKLEIQGKAASATLNIALVEKIDVEFDEKKLSCRFIFNERKHTESEAKPSLDFAVEAICSATDQQRQLVAGGHWISYTPYALLAGAIYCGAYSLIEIGQFCSSVFRVVSAEAASQDPLDQQDSFRTAKLFFQVFQDRNQIQVSQKETLGDACRRIGRHLIKAGLLSTAAFGVYAYDSQYIRI